MFSKACEYGLRAVLFIAQQTKQNHKVSMITIADAIDSPQAFTAKILQQLTKNNIIKSIKGPYGGFIIEENRLADIKLSEIVKILDGESIYMGCGLGLSQCNDLSPCPIHHQFAAIREDLKNMLESTTLDMMLVEQPNQKSFILKR